MKSSQKYPWSADRRALRTELQATWSWRWISPGANRAQRRRDAAIARRQPTVDAFDELRRVLPDAIEEAP